MFSLLLSDKQFIEESEYFIDKILNSKVISAVVDLSRKHKVAEGL